MDAERTRFNQILIELLRGHTGEFPFSQLLEALQQQGLDESLGRELIWQALALGKIEFSPDRSALRILPDDEGKVA